MIYELWSYEDAAIIDHLSDETAYPLDAFAKSRIACQQARRTNLRNTFMGRSLKDFIYAGTDCPDDALVGTDNPLGINHMDVDEDLVTEIIAEITELYSATYVDEEGRTWTWCNVLGEPISAMTPMTYHQERKDWKKTKDAINANLAKLRHKKAPAAAWAIMADIEFSDSGGYGGAVTTREDAIYVVHKPHPYPKDYAAISYYDVGTFPGFPPTGTYPQYGFGPYSIGVGTYKAFIGFGAAQEAVTTPPWYGMAWCAVESCSKIGRFYPLKNGSPITWQALKDRFTWMNLRIKVTGRMDQQETLVWTTACSGEITVTTGEGDITMTGPWGSNPADPSEHTEYQPINLEETETSVDGEAVISIATSDPDVWHGYEHGLPSDAGMRFVELSFTVTVEMS